MITQEAVLTPIYKKPTVSWSCDWDPTRLTQFKTAAFFPGPQCNFYAVICIWYVLKAYDVFYGPLWCDHLRRRFSFNMDATSVFIFRWIWIGQTPPPTVDSPLSPINQHYWKKLKCFEAVLSQGWEYWIIVTLGYIHISNQYTIFSFKLTW